jgi:alpha-glucosidase (family GH31 glycosyl hydrolase)
MGCFDKNSKFMMMLKTVFFAQCLSIGFASFSFAIETLDRNRKVSLGPEFFKDSNAHFVISKPSKDAFHRVVVNAGGDWLRFEFLSDHLIHFEFGRGAVPTPEQTMAVSPMYKVPYGTFHGSSSFELVSNSQFKTSDLSVAVANGCLAVSTRQSGRQIGKYCVDSFNNAWKVLSIATADLTDVYGLGETFDDNYEFTPNRLGRVTETAGDYGNIMKSYGGGAVAEILFPVAYAMGRQSETFLMTLDNTYKQVWDLKSATWRIGMFGDQIAGFAGVAANPLNARRMYMDLTGKAPVPPRKIFGYWMSEYGYENWNEIDDKLSGMRQDHFPIDGFFLDLQWFGNVTAGSDYTNMGRVSFDESNFPDPKGRINSYKQDGIGLIAIEESYVGKALKEYQTLGSQGFLAHQCGQSTTPSYLTGDVTGNTSEWWGRGGMIDWSNDEGAMYWHNTKRQKLIDLGLIGHWLDLGEPEMFDPQSCYHGVVAGKEAHHQDVHNLFSLLWVKSVYDGYQANHVKQRSYSVLRSGNAGMQRFGAGLWSGDIGGNLESYRMHLGSHFQLSWGGIDYYSSDIGGFHRNQVTGDPLTKGQTEENFTQWFANASWFDVPLRSHVMNLDNTKQTAPNRIGHIESNFSNLTMRYELIPYYYSMAHQSYLKGDPLIQPLAMAFPSDLSLRGVGYERLMGDLLMVAAADAGIYFKDVQLPSSTRWYDFRTKKQVVTNVQGGILSGVPTYRDGLFEIPVYVREGALVVKQDPMDFPQGQAAQPQQKDRKLYHVDFFASSLLGQRSKFILSEDDGMTTDYINGSVATTELSAQTASHVGDEWQTTIRIQPTLRPEVLTYQRRQWTIDAFGPLDWQLVNFQVDGQVVAPCHDSDFEDGLWSPVTCVRTPKKSSKSMTEPAPFSQLVVGLNDVTSALTVTVVWTTKPVQAASLHFVCKDSDTTQRTYGMYVVGSDPVLGSWDPLKGFAMTTNGFLKGTWTTVIDNLPVASRVEWKCVKVYPFATGRRVEWQAGNNNAVEIPRSGGFSGMSRASFLRRN